MKFLEAYLWCYVYLALYLPISLLVHLLTGYGDFLGILLIGGIMTAILGVTLSFSDGVFDEEMEPAIVLSDDAPEVEIQTVEVEEDEKERTRIDLESEPKMRTDVDLGQLDADDDDLLS